MDIHDALQLAEELVFEHGLEGWSVTFDRAKTRAGACRPARREIGLSIPLTRLHTEAEVRDTILHEVAHALVGVAHHHDAVWRAKAREAAARERAASPRRRSASTAHGWAPVLPDTGSPATSGRRGSPRALSAVRAASTRGTSSPGLTSASPPRCTRTT